MLRACSLLFALSLPAVAQVSGLVVDSSGRPVAGARVTLQTTDLRTTTAADGSFTLLIPPGPAMIVAAKKGLYNAPAFVTAPASGVRIQADGVVVGNDPTYQLTNPTTCSGCHPEQYWQWQGSPMARAGENKWVYDTFNGTGTAGGSGGFVYTRDSVHASANPASECASCHQPEVWITRNGAPMDPIGNMSIEAMHGISCEVCHKIADIDETRTNYPGIWPGVVTFNRPSQPLMMHQVYYGVLGDSSVDYPGRMRPSYQPQLAAAACAACHQDKNDPDGNGNFEEPNGIISEPTYLEWLASPYADPNSPSYATCVDCHMPASGANEVCTSDPLWRPARQVRSHRIEGTTAPYLENAVDLQMGTSVVNGRLRVDVRIHNRHTGHHVPTGVTVRNMIVLVEAWRVGDAARLAQVSGPTIDPLGGAGSPDAGYYAGLPGRLYAKLIEDSAARSPTFFTDAVRIVWDNRIAALATDATSYEFAIPPGEHTLRVRTRVIYRRAFRALVDAKGWTQDGHGAPLEDIQPPYFGHLMEEASWQGPGIGATRPYGTGCRSLVAGSAGTPSVGSTDFALTLSGARPYAPVLLGLGLDDRRWAGLPLPFDLTPAGAPGCWVLTSLDVLAAAGADGGGTARLALPIPYGVPPGAGLYAQWVVADPSLPLGLATSNGVAITIQR